MNVVKLQTGVSCHEMWQEFELKGEQVLANEVVFSHERHPYNMRLWVIGNEYGPLAAVWASHEQDAFDEACNADLLDGLMLDAETVVEREDEHDGEGIMYLGNASEPFDSIYAWIKEAPIELQLAEVQLAFAEARGGCYDNLDYV